MKLTDAEKKALKIASENGIVSNHGGYGVSRTTLRNLRAKGLLSGAAEMVTTGSGRSCSGRSVSYVDSWGEITEAGRATLAQVAA